MKQRLFQLLSKINRLILPSYVRRDLTRLSKIDQAIIAYRLWVTKNSLN